MSRLTGARGVGVNVDKDLVHIFKNTRYIQRGGGRGRGRIVNN